MGELSQASAFDPSLLPAWVQEQAQRALDLLPDGMAILSVTESGNTAFNLTIGDGDGVPIGHLVVLPARSRGHRLTPAGGLHVKQIAVKLGQQQILVTLGKLLDPQLAGSSNSLVIRIHKDGGYEVTTVSRGTGRPKRYRYTEEQIAGVWLSLDG